MRLVRDARILMGIDRPYPEYPHERNGFVASDVVTFRLQEPADFPCPEERMSRVYRILDALFAIHSLKPYFSL